jgi:beta-glucanase (GH16 family)
VFVDDKKYFTFKNEGTGFMEWPFDQKFYLILNIAYGGNWGGAEGLDIDSLPQKMEVDYVRVYQL